MCWKGTLSCTWGTWDNVRIVRKQKRCKIPITNTIAKLRLLWPPLVWGSMTLGKGQVTVNYWVLKALSRMDLGSEAYLWKRHGDAHTPMDLPWSRGQSLLHTSGVLWLGQYKDNTWDIFSIAGFDCRTTFFSYKNLRPIKKDNCCLSYICSLFEYWLLTMANLMRLLDLPPWCIFLIGVLCVILATINLTRRPKISGSVTKNTNVPVLVNYFPSRKCNYTCGFCFHTDTSSSVLPVEEAKRDLKLLKEAGMR